MKNPQKLVFASNNAKKLHEIRAMLGGAFEILSLQDIGCTEGIPETANTLEGNALIKARHVKEKYGYDCFADDTGLEVAALDGRPGVYSARYAGPECSAADNIVKLLSEMKGMENRSARFRTVIASIIDGEEKTFDGIVEGEITTEIHGDGGFGYDPVFRPEGKPVTFAEMPLDEKNEISHRGRAFRKYVEWLLSS